jgi:hypothetical protein
MLWRSSAPWQVLRIATGERTWARFRRLVYGGPERSTVARARMRQ